MQQLRVGIDSRAAAVYNLSAGLDVGNKCRKGSQIRSVALRHGDLVPSIGIVLYVIRDKETEGKTERRGIIRNREGHIRNFQTDRKRGISLYNKIASPGFKMLGIKWIR